MKTQNYQLELMFPGQMNKDVLFNEDIKKIDKFMNMSIDDFISEIPSKNESNKKYIISSGEQKNSIYASSEDGLHHYFTRPKIGMCFFVINKNSFFVFQNNEWTAVSGNVAPVSAAKSSLTSSEFKVPEYFAGISGEDEISNKNPVHYYYLNSNSLLNLGKNTPHYFTAIIKQNYAKPCSIMWSSNVMWINKTSHRMSQSVNAIDIVTFFKLPETPHFIGHIVAQNYQY